MNIYDFDDTIYDGDTNRDIILYGFKKHPFLVMKALKKAKNLEKEYKRGMVEFERVKETMLSFIFKIKNYPKFINDFVDSHMKKIKPWYISRRSVNDIIISTSYELWVSQFCKRLGIKYVIATKTDGEGKIIGKNCKGPEKLRRLATVIPNAVIVSAYSDSSCDIPILDAAKTAYVVEGDKLTTYTKGYKFKNNN